MKMLEFYHAALESLGLVVDDEGFIFTNYGELKPATLQRRTLVTPTPNQMKSQDWEGRFIFHPLHEVLVQGEAPFLEYIRKIGITRLNMVAYELFDQMLRIAGSTDEQKKLNPQQREFLAVIDKVDKDTLTAYRKLLGAMPFEQTSKSFINIYMRRGGKVGDKSFDRAGIVQFPLYSELAKDGPDVYGVKLRVKDRATFMKLMKFVFPQIEEKGAYDVGSNSKQAPFFDASLRTYLGLAAVLNEQTRTLANVLVDPDGLVIPDEWAGAVEDLTQFKLEASLIPMQAGNHGTPMTEAAKAAAQPQTAAEAPKPVSNILNPQGFVAPAVSWGNPGTFGQQPQATPVKTDRGVDFMSVLNANPGLNAAANAGAASMAGFNGGFGSGPARPQHHVPSWMHNSPAPNSGFGFNQGGFGNNNGTFNGGGFGGGFGR